MKVLSKCICLCHCLCLCICLCHCHFFGQVMSLHSPDQMSQRSRVPEIALCRCSLHVFVFVIVFSLVRSCGLITLIKCLKGHKSPGSLFDCLLKRVCQWVTRSPDELSATGVVFLRYLGRNLFRKRFPFLADFKETGPLL